MCEWVEVWDQPIYLDGMVYRLEQNKLNDNMSECMSQVY